MDFAGISIRHPIVLAAGTCGYADEMSDVLDLSRDVGAMITKSITPEPREGNEPTRILGTQAGMLNAIGLANVGLDRFLAEKMPTVRKCPTTVFGSIAGHSIDDYVRVAEAFDGEESLPAVELNVSCPNVSDGLVFGEDPVHLTELLSAVRPILKQTKLIVKLSPNAPSITAMAQAAVECGADAISLINTFTAMAVDPESRRPRISNVTAGYSGPGVHPIAVRMVHEVYREVCRSADVPILAYGGVTTWEDAAEFLLVGARAVGIGTGLFIDPKIPKRIGRGLELWAERQGNSDLSDLIGQIRLAD